MRSLMFTFTAGWLVCGLTANCRCEEYSVLMRLTAELRWWRRLGVSAGTLCNVLSNLALSYAVLLQLECLQLLQSVIDLGWCRPIVACCPRYMCGRVSRKLSLWYFWKCTYLERLWRIKPRSHYDALHPACRMQCIVVWTAPLNNMAGVIADAYAVLIRSTSRMHTA